MRPALVLAVLALPFVAKAQGVLRGRVRADSSAAVAGATIETGGLSARTDSSGAFELRGIPAGMASISVRAVGFKGTFATMFVTNGQTVSHNFTLERVIEAQTLGAVNVKGEKPLGLAPRSFYDRREQGIGKQYDREQLAKFDVASMANFMATVPGTRVAYGGRNVAFVTNRSPTGDKCAFCRTPAESLLTGFDLRAGFRPGCYMDVYMNGMRVYQYGQTPPQALFDFSTLRTSDFEAIEVYSSAAQMPSQYNSTSSGCGAVLFWSRISADKKP